MRRDTGGDSTRDLHLAVADLYVRLHDRAGLRGGTGDVSGGDSVDLTAESQRRGEKLLEYLVS